MVENLKEATVLKAVEGWKCLGNSFYLKKDYIGAVNAYTEGLKLDPKCLLLLLNRSATYLNMEAYQSALRDAKKALEIDHRHAKAIYRKAKALCGLKKYKEALEFLGNVNYSNFEESDHNEFKKLKLKVESYHHQQQTGDYDIAFMIKSHVSNFACSFDYADFVGPVEERPSPGKGRGLFVTEDVKAGQLLIGSKAFVLDVYNPFHDIEISQVKQSPLPKTVAKILRLAPEKGGDFYKLYAGPELGFLNAEEGDETTIIDSKRIERICAMNSFECQNPDYVSKTIAVIWLLPSSLINHSCFEFNCSQLLLGDFMFLRTVKPIAKGEEILITYLAPYVLLPKGERLRFFEHNGFSCDCKLCKMYNQERSKIYQKEEKQPLSLLFDPNFRDVDIAVSYYTRQMLVCQLDELEMNIYFVKPLVAVSKHLEARMEFHEACARLEKAYEIITRFVYYEDTVNIIVSIMRCYLKAGAIGKAKQWTDRLKAAILLKFGNLGVSVYLPNVAEVNCLMEMKGFS